MNSIQNSFRLVSAGLCVLFCLLANHAGATILYWANNGTGTPTSGTWDTTSSQWTTSTSLTGTKQAWVTADAAAFRAGTGTDSLTITVNIANLGFGGFQDAGAPSTSTVTISGTGSLSLNSGLQGFNNGGGPMTVNVPLVGSGGIAFESGNCTLNGANTYSGGTQFGFTGNPFGGLVSFNNGSAFGSGTITLTTLGNGSALVANGSSAFTIPNNVTVASTATNNFVGNAAGITFSGGWSLGGNVLSLGSGGSSGNFIIIGGVISGSGVLSPWNIGQISLHGGNTYTGGTTLGSAANGWSGIVNFNNGAAFGTGAIRIFSGTSASFGALVAEGSSAITVANAVDFSVASSAAPYLNIVGNSAGITFSSGWNLGSKAVNVGSGGAAGNLITISGVVSGTGHLAKFNSGILSLTGVNTYSGNTTNTAGTLTIGGSGSLGSGSYSATIANNSGGTFNYSSSASQTFSGAIWGNTGTFNVNGPGTLTLSGSADNNALGANINSGGTLVLAKTSGSSVHALGGATTVNSGGTLRLSGSGGDQIFSGVNVTVNSGGVFDANGLSEGMASLTLNGAGISSGGALINNAGTASTITGTAANGFPLGSATSVGGSGTLTMSGVISGTSGLTKIGTGTVILTSAETYTGGTTISAGTLQIGTGGSIAGDVVDNGNFSFNRSGSTYGGNISGPGTVTQAGTSSATLVLSGNNTYSGITFINAGAISVGSATALGTTAGDTEVASGASLEFASSVAISEPLQIAGAGSSSYNGVIDVRSSSTVTCSGPVTLTGDSTLAVASGSGLTFNNASAVTAGANQNLTLTGAGIGTISGVISLGSGGLTKLQSGTWTLSGANSYSGGTTVSAGTLVAGAANTLPASGAVNVSGGTLDIQGNNQAVGAITLASGTITGSSGILSGSSVGLQSGTVSAILDGSAVLTKSTSSAATLTRPNTYTGDTLINSGTLALSGSGSINNSSRVTLTTGATFDVSAVTGGSYSLAGGQTLQGNGAINGSVVVASGATVTPGTSTNTLYFTNPPTLQGTTVMLINKTGSALTNDVLNITSGTLTNGGTLTVNLLGTSDPLTGGETFYLFQAANYAGTFSATNLPSLSAGLNWWAGLLLTNGSLNVNRAPTAQDKSYSRAAGTSLKIAKADLLVGASDPDVGDSVSYDAIASTGSQGATVTENGTYILYQPANNNADTLQYRIKDTRGGTVTKNIAIAVVNPGGLAQSIAWAPAGVSVTFAGIPGQAYDVQRADDANFTVNVVTLTTTNAPTAGIFTINDPTPPSPTGFYRTKQN